MESMGRHLDDVLLRPGDSVFFRDRDHLLAKLDDLDQRVPGRQEGRTKDHREHFCMLRYLRFLAGADLLPLPVTLRKSAEGTDPPDFVLERPDDATESFELTDGSSEEYQRLLTEAEGDDDIDVLFPEGRNLKRREAVTVWANTLFAAFERKARVLIDGRFDIDHLVIYDVTGLGYLVALAHGGRLLSDLIHGWYDRQKPAHQFTKVSVLRDLAMLWDLDGEGRLLHAESPHFRLPVIRANDEEDLQRRLRDLDRYCRVHGISRLRAFGSVLGDRSEGSDEKGAARRFRDDSDLDLLVELEPGTRVTLLDMARMERELSELIGFQVDLRTAGDLSRYFRQEVLDEAVSLHA